MKQTKTPRVGVFFALDMARLALRVLFALARAA